MPTPHGATRGFHRLIALCEEPNSGTIWTGSRLLLIDSYLLVGGVAVAVVVMAGIDIDPSDRNRAIADSSSASVALQRALGFNRLRLTYSAHLKSLKPAA